MGVVSIGSYTGAVLANENLVDKFKSDQKKRHPQLCFGDIKKLAIQAPSNTEFLLNGENFMMPLTGIFELGYGLVNVYELIFKSDVDVNIVYMF